MSNPISYMFKDRMDAARQLCNEIKTHHINDAVVVALPRGGVPIAYIVAAELKVPMDIILSKKIGHPFNKEFAIGSVSLYGSIIDRSLPISEDYLTREIDKVRSHLLQQYILYKRNATPVSLKGKEVIIIDDGIATGNTILAGIDIVRKNYPAKIIVAVPVAPPETISKIKDHVDEIICLKTPGDFRGVGQFYERFDQVSDETVVLLLEKLHQKIAAEQE